MAKRQKSARPKKSKLSLDAELSAIDLVDRLNNVAAELFVIGDAIIGADIDSRRQHGMVLMLDRNAAELKQIGEAVHPRKD